MWHDGTTGDHPRLILNEPQLGGRPHDSEHGKLHAIVELEH